MKSRLRKLGKHLLVNVAIAGGLTGFMVDSDWPLRTYGAALLTNLFFSIGISTVATLVFDRVVTPLMPDGSRWRWLVYPIALFGSVVVGTEIGLQGLYLIFGDRFHASRVAIYRIGAIIGAATVVLAIVYDKLRDHARSVELRAQHAEHELLRARVENLQARLNPHFLFNSLNTVAALVEEDQDKAVDAIERLSDLLRYGLEGTQDAFVSLRQEIAALEDYIALERLRFGDRLRFSVDVDPAALDFEVPSLALQPLVENAVKHGVNASTRGATIVLQGRLEGGSLELDVIDDGPGSSAVGGTSVGEGSVRKRLQLSYGPQARFEAGPVAEGGYRVALRLPAKPFSEAPPCAS